MAGKRPNSVDQVNAVKKKPKLQVTKNSKSIDAEAVKTTGSDTASDSATDAIKSNNESNDPSASTSQIISNTETVQLQDPEILNIPSSNSPNVPSNTEETLSQGLTISNIGTSQLSPAEKQIPIASTPIIGATDAHRRILVHDIPVQRVSFDDPDMQLLSDAIVSRIITIGTHCDVEKRKCAIDLLPADAKWGPRPKYGGNAGASSTICQAGTSDAYVVLSIGRVTRLWFYNKKGEPQPSVNIALNPWSTGTSLRVRRLLTRLSDPSMAREDEATDVVIASRKMAEWLNGNEIVYDFLECFDARNGYKAKSKMPSYDIRDIKPRDTIVLEAIISRFWPKNPNTGVSVSKAFLKIKSISVVHVDTSVTNNDGDDAKSLSDSEDFSL